MQHCTSRFALLAAIFCLAASAQADNFTKVKAELAKAQCTRLTFLSILESDIFDRSDTADGVVVLAKDGRYHATVGEDEFLYDGERFYNYSGENNQVTVENVSHDESFGGEISFITRLDDFYKTSTLRPDSAYRLLRKPDRTENIPDSLVVFLSKGKARLAEVQYFDINGELNRVVFHNQETELDCDRKEFLPSFPDSTEVIELD